MEVDKVDWNERYETAETPWDSGVPSQNLGEFVEKQLIKPCRTLELGCGTGTNAIYLAQAGFEVTAVDLSELAIKRAKEKAEEKGVSVKFLQGDVTDLPDLGAPFPFIFDRGTYHIVRSINLKGFQKTLERYSAPGGFYLVLAGSTNEPGPADQGPPRVAPQDLCVELEFDCFDLVSLEETHFHGVNVNGQMFTPMAWKALFRRRANKRV
jgi:2-polyprenyl-3-methyl-5-hydroxy-6-metoxy-1,4-benzoquinol methylase